MSSSIENFHAKLRKRIGWPGWKWYWPFGKCIFFGCYHIGDYLRILWHRGDRRIFWCGSDILSLGRSPWKYIIRGIKAEHYCDTQIEYIYLKRMGINSEITPMIFDNPDKYQPCRKEGKEAWMCYHKGREDEYGVEIAKQKCDLAGWNLHLYDGTIPEDKFNEEIKNYQIVFRLNKFDGFSEALAKGILLGHDFVVRGTNDCRIYSPLDKEGNRITYEQYWRNKFEESLCKIKG